MALRFAGSKAGGRSNFIPFSNDQMDKLPSSRGGADAAKQGQLLTSAYKNLRKNAPDYKKINQNAIAARGAVNRARIAADAKVDAAETRSEGYIKAAEIQGKAKVAAAKKQAAGAKTGALLGMIGTIGGAMLMAPSDERTKNTIEALDDALTKLRNLRPVSFYYNEEYSCEPDRLHYGFVAQEYVKHMPDATYLDDETGILAIDTTELIGLLVRAIQQLETKVTRMEAKQALEVVAQ